MNKKSIKLGILAIAASAAVSQAAVMVSVDKVGTATAGVGYDIWDVTVTGLTGLDANSGALGTGVSTLGGNFTATNGAAFLTQGSNASQVSSGTTNSGNETSSFVNMDTAVAFTRTGAAPSTANKNTLQSTQFGASWGILASPPQFIGPSSIAADTPLLAEIYVTTGGAFNFSGNVGTQGGGVSPLSFTNVTGPVKPSLTLTTPASNPTTVPGTLDSYVATVLPGMQYQLGGTPDPLGHTFAAFDFSGGTDYSNFFGSLPAGASQVTDAAQLASLTNAFNSEIPGSSFDVFIDLGANKPNGALAISGALPSGVTLNQTAAIPEPGTISLVGIGAVLAMNRRRRQHA